MKQIIFTFTFVLIAYASAKESADPKGKEKADMDQEANAIDLMNVMNECNKSFTTDMAYIESLDASGSFPDETDRTPKCYVRCVLEKTGVATEEGKYDPSAAAKVFGGERGGKPMTDVEDLAKSCAERNEQCKCERAYQFVKCLMEKEIQEYEKAA